MSETLSQLNIVLSTWFLLYINAPSSEAQTFGGLPNDFLTRGAASLLILDHIICDEAGLATEAAMPWVSSHIFKALRDENLLRPERLRNKYSKKVFSQLEGTGLLSAAKQEMRKELAKIKRGDIATDDLRLPRELQWLNSVMFTGVDLPNVLHYDYQEHHFSNLSLAAEVLRGDVPRPEETMRAEERAIKQAKLQAALSIALPDFTLLPPIDGPVAKSAFQENIREERRMMYRYVYGDLSHPEYERFRSSTDFRQRDSIVDTASRFHEADRNMELLLRIRSRTKAIRPHAQQVIWEVVNGMRSLDQVRSELITIRSTIDDAIEHETRPRELQFFAGLYFLLSTAEFFVGSPLYGSLAFLKCVGKWLEANKIKQDHATLGRAFPLSWISGVHQKERRKAKPKGHH